ncbi:MAG: hypothetical protein K9K67_14800 [Bacteriovoracaceae bacterium]|nr:hypothetical protein [Bacteriovoracaceae bacterium]
MHHLVNIFLLILPLLSLASCGSVVKIPLARFSTPETSGIGVTKLEAGIVKALRLQPSPDLRAETVSSEPILGSSLAGILKPSFGLADSVDFELQMGSQQAIEAGIKIQLFGAPAVSAGAGNFSLAVRLGYSIYVSGEEINAGEVYSEPRLDRKMTVESGTVVYELITGYRFTAGLLTFVGVFKDDGRYNLKFKEGVRTIIIHEYKTFGQSFGVQLKKGLLLTTLNAAVGDIEITNKNKKESFFNLGLSFGILF